MAQQPTIPLVRLDKVAAARGVLGPKYSHATKQHMTTVADLATNPANYTSQLAGCVVCVEDRLLFPAARLAGGALALALMHQSIHGGWRLSEVLRILHHKFNIPLALHQDCGALAKGMMVIKDRLTKPNADGYELLAALGTNVSGKARANVAMWASGLPADFIDIAESLELVGEVGRVDGVVGNHNAVLAAVSKRRGKSFGVRQEMKDRTGGLLAFGFDPWAAEESAGLMTSGGDAAVVALVFTAEMLLELGGPDLLVAVYG